MVELQLPQARVELAIRSDLTELARARDFVRRVCHNLTEFQLDEENIDQLELAVTEALSNIVKHAYRGRADQGIDLKIEAYAIVRHPGYVAGILICLGTALCLVSLWALFPAGLASALLILRTRWEDQTLHAELPGYTEYSQRVRSRLCPGVW